MYCGMNQPISDPREMRLVRPRGEPKMVDQANENENESETGVIDGLSLHANAPGSTDSGYQDTGVHNPETQMGAQGEGAEAVPAPRRTRPATYTKMSIPVRIQVYERMLDNALASEEILQALEDKHFSRTRVEELRALVSNVHAQQRAQYFRDMVRMDATEEFGRLWDLADGIYKECLYIARRLDWPDSLRGLLELRGERDLTYIEWYDQVDRFFDVSLDVEKVQEIITEEVSIELLEEGQAAIEAVHSYWKTRLTDARLSERATEEKYDALGDLDGKVALFVDKARRVFKDDHKLLAVMDIRPRGRRATIRAPESAVDLEEA